MQTKQKTTVLGMVKKSSAEWSYGGYAIIKTFGQPSWRKFQIYVPGKMPIFVSTLTEAKEEIDHKGHIDC